MAIAPTLVTPALAWDGNGHLLYTQTVVGGGIVASKIWRIGLDSTIEPYSR